jgi:lipoprotein-anchoring transpeptidase ErfK/SrfK
VQNSQRPDKGHSVYSRNREALLVMTASAALLAGLATPADALPFNQQPAAGPPPSRPHGTVLAAREKKPAKPKESEDMAARAKGVLSVVVSIDKQQLTLYSDGQPIAHSRVSTGVPGHPTPTGVFSIIQKDRWHRSNIYYNAPMYYMQRITWSGVAMHQGVVPTGPASHGCIRLPESFARQMWGITKLGVRVLVTRGGEVTPVPVSSERLFAYKPAEPKPEPKSEPDAASVEPPKPADGTSDPAKFAANKGDGIATDALKSGSPALDAMAYAIRAPRETAATTSEAVKSAHDAFEPGKPGVAKVATTTPTTTTGSEDRPLKPGPISVFISRKEGKLFVRKGFDPVFDVPVTFEQPDQPLGTHVFTAVAFNDDNSTLRWNVMSMPGNNSSAPVKPVKKAEKGKKAEPPAPVVHASSATEALNRVTIPQQALDRISALMSPGASLVISDKGLGSETGKGTDFIVLTR